MNNYILTDLYVNQKESFSATITKEMQDSFTKISGDINPIHISPKFAKSKGYEDVLVYGMLTASFYSTLVGVYLPGEHCVFQEISTSFYKPVYIGDTLFIEGKISEINKILSRVIIKAEIRNQNRERVSKASLIIGILEGEKHEQ